MVEERRGRRMVSEMLVTLVYSHSNIYIDVCMYIYI